MPTCPLNDLTSDTITPQVTCDPLLTLNYIIMSPPGLTCPSMALNHQIKTPKVQM